MSAEAAVSRKRGRPRKVIPDTTEAEPSKQVTKKAAASKKLQDIANVTLLATEEETTLSSSPVKRRAAPKKTKVSSTVAGKPSEQKPLPSVKKAAVSASPKPHSPADTASSSCSSSPAETRPSSTILAEVEKRKKAEVKSPEVKESPRRQFLAADLSDQPKAITTDAEIPSDNGIQEKNPSSSATDQKATVKNIKLSETVSPPPIGTQSYAESGINSTPGKQEIPQAEESFSSPAKDATPAPPSRIIEALKRETSRVSETEPPPSSSVEPPVSSSIKDTMIGQPPPAATLSAQKPRVLNQEELKALGSRRKVAPRPTKPQDIRQTKEYKTVSRKWIAIMATLPILFTTSWVLYQRVYRGKQPKHLLKTPQETTPSLPSPSLSQVNEAEKK